VILTVNRLNSKQVKQNSNTFQLFDFPKSRLKFFRCKIPEETCYLTLTAKAKVKDSKFVLKDISRPRTTTRFCYKQLRTNIVKTVSFVALCSLYVPKIRSFYQGKDSHLICNRLLHSAVTYYR